MLKPRQLKTIELLVAGANDTQAASIVHVNPATVWRWKNELEFATELKNRTADETANTRRVAGAQTRASVECSMLATTRLRAIIENPKASSWLELQAVQTSIKHARWAAEKFDPDFNKVETVGRNDPERQKVADELTRRIEQLENQDRTLARLQQYEERRMQERIRQREDELLRRLNVMCKLDEQDKEYMHRFYRREDDWDVAMENTRREKARAEFAAAAGVSIDTLPAPTPFKWADMREQFKGFVDPLPEPTTPEQAAAEIERAKNLSYPDPNSPEEKARQAKFAEDLKAVEADYRANVMPKAAPSPIEREDRGMGVSAMSNETVQDRQTSKTRSLRALLLLFGVEAFVLFAAFASLVPVFFALAVGFGELRDLVVAE